MQCPKCGFDREEYARALKPEFESSHHNLLLPMRFKAKVKGAVIGILFMSFLMLFNPSPRTSLWMQTLAFFSDSILTGVFIFLVTLGAVFGFFLANSWKEERLWQKFVANRLKELEQV